MKRIISKAFRGLKRAVRVVAWLALSVGVVEVVLRVYYEHSLAMRCYRPSIARVGYELDANVVHDYWHDGRLVKVSTDSAGRRVVPGTSANAPLITVHVIGDSQVFGWGLLDDETIPSCLQQILGRGYRVQNWGVPGYGPYAYADLAAMVPKGDIVFIVHSEVNDLEDSYSPRAPAFARNGYLVPRGFYGEQLPGFLFSSYTFVELVELRVALGDARLPAPVNFNPATRSAATVLAHRVQKLYEPLREARAATFRTATIPWEGVSLPDRRCLYRPVIENPARLSALPDDCGLAVAFDEYPAPDELFQRDFHLSPKGTRLAAQRLADEVTKMTRAAKRP